MQGLDRVGPREDQEFVATLEGVAAEIVGVEFLGLQIRARGAVEDEDPISQRGQVGVVTAGTGEGWTKVRGHWLFRLPA